MSSDSELGPTPPKHRRLTRSLMNDSEETACPPVRSSTSGQCIKITDDDEVCVLSDIEIDATSQADDANPTTRSDPESSPVTTLDTSIPEPSKRTAEARNNAEKDEAGSSSAGVDSDSIESEKCPICWLPYTSQEVATPSTCDHRFCFHCIMEWSKTMNTCPVDRQPFSLITVRPKFGSKITRLVPIETRASTDTDGDTEDRDLDYDEDSSGVYPVYPDLDDEEYNLAVGHYGRMGIGNELAARSSEELDTTYSTDEDLDPRDVIRVALQYSSTENGGDDDDDDDDDDDGNDSGENANPVIVISSSSDEEVRVSSSSEYNELSSSSSASPPAYFSPNSSNSSANSPSSSPTNSFSVSLSPTHSQPQSPSSSFSLSSSSSPPRSFSPSPSPSPSPSSDSLSDSLSCSSVSS